MTQQVSIESKVTTNCLTNSFVFMLGHCVNVKTIRYDSTNFNRIVGDIELSDRFLCIHDRSLYEFQSNKI